jgi:hypothetical protein
MVDGASWETGGAPDQTALGPLVCADPAPDPGYANTTQSLQRIPDGADTDASTDADFQLLGRTPAVVNGTTLPPDFHLLAASGGLTPWENIYRVEIDALGQGDFRYAEPAERETDTWTQIVPFPVSSYDLLDLWATIQAQGFFSLPPASYDPVRHDGWFCDIVVTADGVTRHVKVQNFTLPPFNAVAVKINEKTPPGNDLYYNDIAP